jgi:hypothetical protein
MSTQPKNFILQPSKSPNLPIAPVEYSQQYVDQLTNALRLYFGQLDNFSQAVILPASGVTADRPIDTGPIKLRTGQFYFDTTLGLPIWWDGSDWIDAAGNVV